MKFVKYIIVICVTVLNLKLSAQQSAQFSQYMFNKYSFNPAYAGLDFSLSSNLIYRHQWDALPGNPTNFEINTHLPFYIWSGALGVKLSRRSAGALSQTALEASYNYVAATDFGLLSLGGRIGFSQLNVDGSRIITPDGSYDGGLINHNDPILLENTDRGIGLLSDFGIYFYNKKIEAGISIGQLPPFSVGLANTNFDRVTHATGFAQYNFEINDEVKLMQSILLKTDFDIVQTDISSVVQINGSIFGGVGMRGYSSTSLDAVSVLTGLRINDHYTLSYSFDIGISGLQRVHDGTHELVLNYNLRKPIATGLPPKIIYNPRFL